MGLINQINEKVNGIIWETYMVFVAVIFLGIILPVSPFPNSFPGVNPLLLITCMAFYLLICIFN